MLRKKNGSVKSLAYWIGRVLVVSLLLGVFISVKHNAVISDKFFIRYLRPVALSNCSLLRLGKQHDGGYISCSASLGKPQAAFSYGIAGRDSWGCAVANRYHLPVYQFDPYDVRHPKCNASSKIIHFMPLGVAGHAYHDSEKRVFDTFLSHLNHFAATKRVIVKMDIEGDEWQALQTALDDGSINKMTQLLLETHNLLTENMQQAALIKQVLRRLHKEFYIVHLHVNNYDCNGKNSIIPGSVVEISYVNRHISGLTVDHSKQPKFPSTLDSPNNPAASDCPIDAEIFNSTG